MGFLSTVPSDADQRLRDAVKAAANADDNFPGSLSFLRNLSAIIRLLRDFSCSVD